MKLEVGQQLWYVPRNGRRRAEGYVTVLKVGRKWAQLDCRERINIETLAELDRAINPQR